MIRQSAKAINKIKQKETKEEDTRTHLQVQSVRCDLSENDVDLQDDEKQKFGQVEKQI